MDIVSLCFQDIDGLELASKHRVQEGRIDLNVFFHCSDKLRPKQASKECKKHIYHSSVCKVSIDLCGMTQERNEGRIIKRREV